MSIRRDFAANTTVLQLNIPLKGNCMPKSTILNTVEPVATTSLISRREVQDFFSKLTFHMNKTLKTWGESLQLPYANKAKFLP